MSAVAEIVTATEPEDPTYSSPRPLWYQRKIPVCVVAPAAADTIGAADSGMSSPTVLSSPSASPLPSPSSSSLDNSSVKPTAPPVVVAVSQLETTATPSSGAAAVPLSQWILILIYSMVMTGDVLSASFSGSFLPQFLVDSGHSTLTVSIANGALWWASIATLIVHTAYGSFCSNAASSSSSSMCCTNSTSEKNNADGNNNANHPSFPDQYGAQIMLFIAVTLQTIAPLLITVVSDTGDWIVPVIIIARALQGIGSALIWVFCTVAACNMFKIGSTQDSHDTATLRLKFALSVLSLAGTLGELISPPVGTALYLVYGLNGSYGVLTIIMSAVWCLFVGAHCCIRPTVVGGTDTEHDNNNNKQLQKHHHHEPVGTVAVLTPRSRTAQITASAASAASSSADDDESNEERADALLPNPLFDPVVLAVSIALALTDMQYGVSTILGPLFMSYTLDLADATIGWILTVFSAVYVATAGLLTLMMSSERIGPCVSPRVGIATGLALLAVTNGVFTFPPRDAGVGAIGVMMLIQALAGAANAVNVLLAPHYITVRSKQLGFAKSDRCMSVFYALFFTGRGIGVAFAAISTDETDAAQQQRVLWVVCGVLALATPAFWYLTRVTVRAPVTAVQPPSSAVEQQQPQQQQQSVVVDTGVSAASCCDASAGSVATIAAPSPTSNGNNNNSTGTNNSSGSGKPSVPPRICVHSTSRRYLMVAVKKNSSRSKLSGGGGGGGPRQPGSPRTPKTPHTPRDEIVRPLATVAPPRVLIESL